MTKPCVTVWVDANNDDTIVFTTEPVYITSKEDWELLCSLHVLDEKLEEDKNEG